MTEEYTIAYKKYKSSKGTPIPVKLGKETGKISKPFMKDGVKYIARQYRVTTLSGLRTKMYIPEIYVEYTETPIKVNLICYLPDPITCTLEACEKKDYRYDSKVNEEMLNSDNSFIETNKKIEKFIKSNERTDKSLRTIEQNNLITGAKLRLKMRNSVLDTKGIELRHIRNWNKWKKDNPLNYEILNNLISIIE